MNTDKHIDFSWMFFDKNIRMVEIKYNVLVKEGGGGYEETVRITFESFESLVDTTNIKRYLKLQ
jgi:hypothetical protein